MTQVTLTPAFLSGTVPIPPSKSVSHRAVICAALAKGPSKVDNLMFSKDITVTTEGMRKLGANIRQEGSTLYISGGRPAAKEPITIDCGESGSTLRFLIPLGLIGIPVTFTGKGKLVERPLDSYFAIFEKQGISYETNKSCLPLTVNGRLQPGHFELPGDVSSQFISGLLFALPLLDGDSTITITSELESYGYVDLTLEMLERFGVRVEHDNHREYRIQGGQQYKNSQCSIEGDYSQSAFWLTAGTIGRPISCSNLYPRSLQGDKAVIDIIRAMGGHISEEQDTFTAHPTPTSGTTIDASQCPDLVPVLTVLAAVSKGTTHIIKAGRLRIKECDRLKAIAQELNKVGAHVEEQEDSLIIHGKPELQGGVVESWNDHRIAMAMAVASIKCKEPVTILGSECVSKSYPHFWEDFAMLGGKVHKQD